MQQDARETIATELTACPVCGSFELLRRRAPETWIGEEVFGLHRGAFGVSACARCSFEFVNPRPAARLLDAFYGGTRYTCHDPTATDTSDARAAQVLDFIRTRVDGRRIVDFGCGGGVFLRVAKRAGWHAVGYDPGVVAVENCRRDDLPATTDLAELPLGAFDAVVLNHVFEHVVDHRRTLRDIRALLAPGGRVFIECPNVGSLRARLSSSIASRHLRFDERYRAFPIHLSYFTPATLSRVLELGGFAVDEIVTWGFGLEELLRDGAPRDRARATSSPRRAIGGVRGAVRHLAKAVLTRLILDNELGENVMVVAQPVPTPRDGIGR